MSEGSVGATEGMAADRRANDERCVRRRGERPGEGPGAGRSLGPGPGTSGSDGDEESEDERDTEQSPEGEGADDSRGTGGVAADPAVGEPLAGTGCEGGPAPAAGIEVARRGWGPDGAEGTTTLAVS